MVLELYGTEALKNSSLKGLMGVIREKESFSSGYEV